MRKKILLIFAILFIAFVLLMGLYLLVSKGISEDGVLSSIFHKEDEEENVSESYESHTYDDPDSLIKIDIPDDWNIYVSKRISDGEVPSTINDIKITTTNGNEIYLYLNDYQNQEEPFRLENTGLYNDCYDVSMFTEVFSIAGEPIYVVKEEYRSSVVEPDAFYSQSDHYLVPSECRSDMNKVSYSFALGSIEDVFIMYESSIDLVTVFSVLSTIEIK